MDASTHSNCPAGDLLYCPLYVAAHEPNGRGCIGSDDMRFYCRVVRGQMNFEAAVMALAKHGELDPRDAHWLPTKGSA